MRRLGRLQRLEQKAPDRCRDLSEWSDAGLAEYILSAADKPWTSELSPVLEAFVKDFIREHSTEG